MSTVRPVELVRGGWGLALLVAPDRILTRVHGIEVDPRSRAVTRVLGARQLGQAALSGLDPSPEVLAMGVWVDLAHAVTAVGLAVVDHTRARAGLVDAAVAATWAAWGLRDLRDGRSTSPRHDRRRDTLARAVLALVPGGTALRDVAARDRARDTHSNPQETA